MTDSFREYYQCPREFATFTVREPVKGPEGYFAFRGAVCYGRSNRHDLPTDAESELPDLFDEVDPDHGAIRLPFDFSEVVDNLRQERYHHTAPTLTSKLTSSGLSERLYYFIRPALPVVVRKHLQRIRLRGWDKIRFPRWPVDLTVETLMDAGMGLQLMARGSAPIPFIWFWPEGASGAAIVTHDVEAPAGRDFCERLMAIDAAAGIRSSFQIVPELRYQTSPDLLAKMRRGGFEVNVHDLNHDGHLFQDREQFLQRAERINQYVTEYGSRGFRSACMYREQAWLDALDVSYDMSVPTAAHLEPQRGGCCTVMPYFNGNIVELPLTTVQDYSLFHIIGDYSISMWGQQIDLILSKHGLITILTHPDYLIEPRAQDVYRQLLDYLGRIRTERNVWFALPGEVERWWRNRQNMTLFCDNSGWQIDGPDKERARVAYAALEGNRVVYTIPQR
jgi:hypothetical protein